MKRSVIGAAAAFAVAIPTLEAQQRAPAEVFHSTQSANLPTAATMREGDWLFEISHRFLPTFSEGVDALWGLDGPVYNRLGLSYSVSDWAMLGVLRTNLEDNVELNTKLRLYEGGSAGMPFLLGLMGGVAWNTDPFLVDGAEDNEVQLYGQLMLNALFAERLALGVVPTIVRNPRIQDDEDEIENVFVLGLHGQLYVSDAVSLLGEWILGEERLDLESDSGTFGIELETRGHFFKLLATNQPRMNPTQFLGGTPFEFGPDEWRFGFNLTRLLPF